MANVTIATIQADSTIAVAVVKDFLKYRGVDVTAISTAADARAAMEAELRKDIKQDVIAQRNNDAAASAIVSAQAANNSAVVLV